jgi:hypothetical protein
MVTDDINLWTILQGAIPLGSIVLGVSIAKIESCMAEKFAIMTYKILFGLSVGIYLTAMVIQFRGLVRKNQLNCSLLTLV